MITAEDPTVTVKCR